jgi:uncharacterized protein (TIGR00375 family)
MGKFIADLHLHSSYSRATSPSLNFDTLSEWAKLKGIHLLASADFTHPVWWKKTRETLKESKNSNLYEYKGVHFILGTEISSIYSQGGKLRRIHSLIYFPQFSDVEKFNLELGKKTNLTVDGRPITGLSARQLLEMALEVNEKAIFIPAHAWTPWFSLYGSNSGFDSINECFGDLVKYIYAIETGLSSDPAMNWRIAELDNRSIVSFSDAHSCPKLGREATILDADFTYEGILKALKNQKIAFTIEFFPEEGKYHFTGHRNCNVKQSPSDTARDGIICSQCNKKLTIGVMQRVVQLAEKNRSEGVTPKGRPGFRRMVPLIEIISEALGKPTSSPAVSEEYRNLIKNFGSEFSVLLKAPIDEIEKSASSRIAEGVDKVRRGDIVIEPGYDGVYGVVKIWNEKSKPSIKKETPLNQKEKQASGQTSLFD